MARRWDGRPAAVARGTLVALSLATGILLLVCWAGSAVAAPARYQGSLDSMVRYLQNDQNPDGGFGSEPGAGSNNDVSAWVALALAATGINPRDQTPSNQHYIGGHSVYGYLTEHAGTLSSTTDFERELLLVDATGTSPTDFGGVNLLEKILQSQMTQRGPNDGAFVHDAGSGEPTMNDTIFAILALSPIHEPAVQDAVRAAAEWVEREQDCDHGWPSTAYRTGGACRTSGGSLPGEPQSEVDMTGAAIEALNAAGRQGPAKEVEQHAFEYLETAQDANGGFPEEPGDPEPNVASTAWVAQAMWSAGINPETWLTHSGLASEEPLGYMASLQQEDGHIRWEQSQEWNGVWMTAYVGTAMTGDTYPPPPPPDEPLPQAPTETSSDGQGGASSNPGGGVTAGGGGNGAPLFSRPQLGSKGHAPGGARQLKDQRHNTTKHHHNPGPPRKTPVPTATTASVHHAKKHDPASHKGTGGALTGTGAGGEEQSGGREVKGLLIGAPADTLEPGAPGLRGAGAGTNQTPWLAIGVAAALLLSALIGAQIERRPRLIL
jgi:Prenyltransferase and squalene oxidase repeat